MPTGHARHAEHARSCGRNTRASETHGWRRGHGGKFVRGRVVATPVSPEIPCGAAVGVARFALNAERISSRGCSAERYNAFIAFIRLLNIIHRRYAYGEFMTGRMASMAWNRRWQAGWQAAVQWLGASESKATTFMRSQIRLALPGPHPRHGQNQATGFRE